MRLFPEAIEPYAKAWVTLLGIIVSAVVTAVPAVPTWVSVLGAIATSFAVFWTPNRDPDYVGRHG